jgi:hypothetical protein
MLAWFDQQWAGAREFVGSLNELQLYHLRYMLANSEPAAFAEAIREPGFEWVMRRLALLALDEAARRFFDRLVETVD